MQRLLMILAVLLVGCGSWHLEGIPKSDVPEYVWDYDKGECKRYSQLECATVDGPSRYQAGPSRRIDQEGRQRGPIRRGGGYQRTPFQRCTRINYLDCMNYKGWAKY